MRRFTILIFGLLLLPPFGAVAEVSDWYSKGIDIPDIEVVGRRPMSDIGVARTSIDSTSLKSNIALSMADILNYNSSLFVKNYGRATLSTVSFRGTSASHTQVLWNGMRLNSPMLGMTDFSLIPSYLVDGAALLHGSSSLSATAGGLGGAVLLDTRPSDTQGFGLQFVQGAGSYTTFDDYLRLTYGNERWQSSTRVVFAYSANDFHYINRDKKENIYDSAGNIVEQYHPREYNRNGEFRDTHLLQELYYKTKSGDRLGLNCWFLNSRRELPLTTTDYGVSSMFENFQRENTLRSILSYERTRAMWSVKASAGYIYSWQGYDYSRNDHAITRSRTHTHTIYGAAHGLWSPHSCWLLSADLSMYGHWVASHDLYSSNERSRMELSAVVTARWQPHERVGASLTLREEMYGPTWSIPVPALTFEVMLSRKGAVMLRGSGSRNFRAPSLNDLYFQPGGNPNLRSERGWSYDAGISFDVARARRYRISGSATWFDSYINDWISWLPTPRGYFSPRNVERVHAYGVEVKSNIDLHLAKDWRLNFDGSLSWTPSINCGRPISDYDNSVGRQLPYIPKLSASFVTRLTFRTWSLAYKWCYYSERYTMSSNEDSLTGRLPQYFISNIELSKTISFRPLDLSIKGIINNLFDEEYQTLPSRPMPGINFEIFIGITPHFKNRSGR